MDERRLWDRIRAEPDDDAPRLVYADWLQDRGDRAGELIALECELARVDPRLPRGRDLMRGVVALRGGHLQAWQRRLPPNMRVMMHRGLPEGVSAEAAPLLAQAAHLAELLPLFRVVNLEQPSEGLASLLAAPLVARLTWLMAVRSDLGRRHVDLLAEASGLAGLRTLDLWGNAIDDVSAEALAAASSLGRLESLSLAGNVIGDEGAAALARSTRLGALTDLALASEGREHDNHVGPEGAAALAGRAWRSLFLGGNPLGNAGAAALAGSPKLAGLERLDLSRAGIGPSGAFALAASPHLGALRVLELAGNPIGDEGARALAASPFLSRELVVSIDESVHEAPRLALAARVAVVTHSGR